MYCPLPGKCRYDDYQKAGVHLCVRPVCVHLRQQRMGLAGEISRLLKYQVLSEAQRATLCACKREYAETLRQKG